MFHTEIEDTFIVPSLATTNFYALCYAMRCLWFLCFVVFSHDLCVSRSVRVCVFADVCAFILVLCNNCTRMNEIFLHYHNRIANKVFCTCTHTSRCDWGCMSISWWWDLITMLFIQPQPHREELMSASSVRLRIQIDIYVVHITCYALCENRDSVFSNVRLHVYVKLLFSRATHREKCVTNTQHTNGRTNMYRHRQCMLLFFRHNLKYMHAHPIQLEVSSAHSFRHLCFRVLFFFSHFHFYFYFVFVWSLRMCAYGCTYNQTG